VHIYIYIYIYIYMCVCIISELHSFEGQYNFPVRLQYLRFCIKNNTPRRLFAWRHLKTGQYVAQSDLHLHQSKPHSCEDNKKTVVRKFEMQVDLPSHWANRPLHLIKFIMWIITYIMSADVRKQNYLNYFIMKRKMRACYRTDKFPKNCSSNVVEYQKIP